MLDTKIILYAEILKFYFAQNAEILKFLRPFAEILKFYFAQNAEILKFLSRN